jgi:hypothetical protein
VKNFDNGEKGEFFATHVIFAIDLMRSILTMARLALKHLAIFATFTIGFEKNFDVGESC